MSKHNIVITDEKLYKDLYEYCKMNGEKLNVFCQNLLKKYFLTEIYGDAPFLIKKNKSSQESYDSKIEITAPKNNDIKEGDIEHKITEQKEIRQSKPKIRKL